MKDVGWLKQSLLEARRETEGVPEWAREMLRAWDAHYGPGTTSTGRTTPQQAAGAQQRDTTGESST
jgi:hypothetical protein